MIPLPKRLSVPIVLLATAIAAWVAVASYGASRYRDGRRSVTESKASVLTSVTVARAADSTAQAATDTIVQRLVVTRWRVDTLTQAIPDTLQTVPEIAALIGVTRTLTAQVDTLTHALDVARAVSRLRASIDSAALESAQGTIVQQQDQIAILHRRPTWRAVAIALGAGLTSGVLLRR